MARGVLSSGSDERNARFACAACGIAVAPMFAVLDAFAAGIDIIPTAGEERLLVTARPPVAEAPCGS
jgi:hypothetical protein